MAKHEFDTNDYTKYKVTGVLRDGRRFRAMTFDRSQARMALAINLWNGSVWGLHKKTHKWELLKRVHY